MQDDLNLQKRNKPAHLWKPGQSGNPAGRPVGARSRLEEPFLESLRKKWESEGDTIIDRVAAENPEKIIDAMVRCLPRELAVSVEQRSGPMDSNAMRMLRRFVDVISAAAPTDAEQDAVFDVIEHALRAHFAKQIDPN